MINQQPKELSTEKAKKWKKTTQGEVGTDFLAPQVSRYRIVQSYELLIN